MCFIPSFALDVFPTSLESAVREDCQVNVSGSREIRLHERWRRARKHSPADPGKRAGVNAGALPSLAAAEEADGDGAGSLTMAMCDASDLRGPYRSYRLGLPLIGRFRVLASS